MTTDVNIFAAHCIRYCYPDGQTVSTCTTLEVADVQLKLHEKKLEDINHHIFVEGGGGGLY